MLSVECKMESVKTLTGSHIQRMQAVIFIQYRESSSENSEFNVKHNFFSFDSKIFMFISYIILRNIYETIRIYSGDRKR